MALVNNIIAGPNPDINYGAYTSPLPNVFCNKFNVTLADIVGLGAFTTGDIVLMNMPARGVILYTYTKHTIAVSGGGITASTAIVKTATGNRGGSLNIFAAVSATAYDVFLNVTASAKEAAITGTTPVLLSLTSTTANLGAALTGGVEVVVCYAMIP